MPRTRIAETVGDWAFLNEAVTPETTTDAPDLQLLHEKLRSFLEDFQRLSQEQSLHEARKQAITRQMNEILEEGRKTASALKLGLKLRLGNRNPQLIKFGIQPLRARRRRRNAEPAPGSEETPSSGDPSA
jgi:hypothetical protein